MKIVRPLCFVLLTLVCQSLQAQCRQSLLSRQPIRSVLQAQPVRNIVQAVVQVQPVRTVLQPVRNVVQAQPVRTILQAQPVRSVLQAQPVRTFFNNTTCQNSTVESASCDSYERNQAITSDDASSRAFAAASAQARAGRMAHFTNLEFPRVRQPGRVYQSGVGFSTTDPTPMTCLGEPGNTDATCSVVRGAKGWYASCVK